jgi:hypothetical protein
MASFVAEPKHAKRGAHAPRLRLVNVAGPVARAYFAIKFRSDYQDRPWISELSDSLDSVGIQTSVMVRDHEMWGEHRFSPQELMERTFKEIDLSDLVFVEFSEKGVGLGIEAGYAFATHKPIIVIAKCGSDVSPTLAGIARKIIFYSNPSAIGAMVIREFQN